MADDRVDETEATEEISVAEVVEKRARLSIVWIFPIVAALLGGWLLYKTLAEAGIPIKVTFETASGLEAGSDLESVFLSLTSTAPESPDGQPPSGPPVGWGERT